MNTPEPTIIHKKEVYEEEIAPLVKRLNLLLRAHGIPYFFSACVENDENGSEYVHDGNLCGSNGIALHDDKITDFLRILCGFRVKSAESEDGGYYIAPPADEIEIDFGDI
jgi:hypothetical protein